MNESFFNRLKLLVSFEITSFESRLTQLSAMDYPTEVGPELIKELLKELEKQRLRVDVIAGDYPFDAKGAGDRLRSEHREILSMLFFLGSLENAQTRKVPWSIVPGLEVFSHLLMPNQRLLTSTAGTILTISRQRREQFPTWPELVGDFYCWHMTVTHFVAMRYAGASWVSQERRIGRTAALNRDRRKSHMQSAGSETRSRSAAVFN